MRSLGSKLILVIDDSVDNCLLLETLFCSDGWDVHTASDGAAALMILAELSRLPDLILLDLQMPGMSGKEFLIERNRIERLRDIPIVIMSGSTDEVANEDIHGYLPKPLHLRTILERVNSFI